MQVEIVFEVFYPMGEIVQKMGRSGTRLLDMLEMEIV